MTKKLLKIAKSLPVAALGLQATAGTALAQSLSNVNIEPGRGFATDIGSFINGLLSFVMVIAALLVFLYLILGGMEWITSGGDKGKTEGARNKITSAIIGLVILAASYAILLVVLNFLGFSNLSDVFSNANNGFTN